MNEWVDELSHESGTRCDTSLLSGRCDHVAKTSVEQNGEIQNVCSHHLAQVILSHSPRRPITVRLLPYTVYTRRAG